MTIEQSNRIARAAALVKTLSHKGQSERAARLADKVFGPGRWVWAGLFRRTALISGEWNTMNS